MKSRRIKRAMSKYDDVKKFHETYKMAVGTSDITDDARMQMRMDLVTEEVDELKESWETNDEAGMLDALGDLCYVAIGWAVEMGWDFDEAWRRIQESNMSKLDENGEPIFRGDGKVLKGPNFKPPVFDDLVQ
jgi:predicted HAD superfamily Cof-like phosphohydrolase